MLTAPARAWSVLQQIFAAPWETFPQAHPRYQTPYDDELVAKMLAGGQPAQSGYGEYRCLHGGQGTPVVALSGKSSWCLRCAKVSTENGGSQVSKVWHEGVLYRHIILPVPAMFRRTFYQHAAGVCSALRRCGAQGLEAFSRTVQGQALTGGSMTVLHPHGRHGPYHPHVPVLATRGGYAKPGGRWEPLDYVPDALRRRKWQWHLLTMLRQTLKTEAVAPCVDTCCRQAPDGLGTHGQKGALPTQAQRVARDGATDVVSPPSSVRRMERSEGERVTSH